MSITSMLGGKNLSLVVCSALALVALLYWLLAARQESTQKPNPDDTSLHSAPDVRMPNPPLSFQSASPAPELNVLFEQTDGWIGADGAHSVVLSPQKTLWLFSDTWVGKIRDGKRTDATIVNNTVALQDGIGAAAKMDFVIRRNADGKPVALITPADGHGWFWLQTGAKIGAKLDLFLSQIEKTADPGVFGFRQVGQWLGVVSNPQDHPTAWRITQHKLPHTVFSPERELTFGAALLTDGEFLYVFGTDEDIRPTNRERYLIVARVPADQADDFAAWRFYCQGKWETDFRSASRLTPRMASDASVSFQPTLKQYVLVYTDRGLSPDILGRTASKPWGPWSAPTVLYHCPESSWDKRIFCYGAKAHPHLAGSDELVISYTTNSFDFWHVAQDARLYWPRFVRIQHVKK